MIQILADSGNSTSDVMKMLMPILGWVATFVTGVLGVVLIKNTRSASKAEGKAEGKAEAMAVKIENNPLEVMLRKEYVTRGEFNDFRTEVKLDVRDMRGLFDKAVTLITERDERTNDKIGNVVEQLGDKIEEVAAGAYEGRRRLHDKVNEHTKILERVQVNSDVSKAMGKLGAAVMTLAKTGNPQG